MFPLRAREGGVLVRAGQTEAGVDLARLAGLTPGGRDLRNHERRRHHGAGAATAWSSATATDLKMISVADLIRYRMKHEKFIRRAAEGCIETEFGEFRTVAYASDIESRVSPGAGARRCVGQGERAGAHALALRVWRCFRLDRLRLRAGWCATRCAHRGGRAAGCWFTCTKPAPASASSAMPRGEPRMRATARFHALQGRSRPAATTARARHRRADPQRPGAAHHPPADQPSPEDRGAGRLRDRDCGSDSVGH